MIKVKKIPRQKLSLLEKAYIIQILQGMVVTFRHIFFNLINMSKMPVLEYPEKKKTMPKGYRGLHRLTQREDGSVKCVACMMCATACPAECIHIDAAEHPDPTIEKYPSRFDIDLLRCVYCGYCVEACPVDAIRMDSGVNSIFNFKRENFIITKEELLKVQAQYPEDAKPKTPPQSC